MAVSSMTGFARGDGRASFGTFFIEVKSVNGKGLDVRLNVPRGLAALENPIKAKLSERFSRGSFQVSLKYDAGDAGVPVKVNDAALKSLVEAYETADGQLATGQALATLMTARGVLEEAQGEIDVSEADEAAMLSVVDETFDRLVIARNAEGDKLSSLLFAQVEEVAALTAQARAYADDQITQIRARFEGRLAELDTEGRVDPERLAAEVAVLLTKADVTEELDRLDAHIVSAKDLLDEDKPVGRKLGFLAQEFHREANTLCSKSASLNLTNVGLALKSVIDQLKEQSANVE
ncbi:MAG: YicC/YloC family endoribonuclease [Pseudomonadota bacterium]